MRKQVNYYPFKFQINLWSVRRKGPVFICIPKFKRIALFVQKYNVSFKTYKISKLGQVTRATPTYRSLYGPYTGLTGGVCLLCLTKFEAGSPLLSIVIRVSQYFEIGHVTRPPPRMSHFEVHTQEVSVPSWHMHWADGMPTLMKPR